MGNIMAAFKNLSLTLLSVALLACGDSKTTTTSPLSDPAAQANNSEQILDSDENWSPENKESNSPENISTNSNSQLAIDSDSNWSLQSNTENNVVAPNDTIDHGNENSQIDSDSNWQASGQ
jgi:hypothetical protein